MISDTPAPLGLFHCAGGSTSLRRLADPEEGAERLEAAGTVGAAVWEGGSMLARCSGALLGEAHAERPAFAFRVPGRLELLGKHTDYAGGRSLLAAVDQALWVVAVPRDDGQVQLRDVARSVETRFPLDPGLARGAGWRNYPTTVARRLVRNFPEVRTGASIAFASLLPSAAGLSSSSALVIGIFAALAAANRLDEAEAFRERFTTPEELAAYLGAVENGRAYGGLAGDLGVGTLGGSQDHTAILCSQRRGLVRYGWSPTRREGAVDLPAGYAFVVAGSGVRAEKTGPALERYNRAAELMEVAAGVWREHEGAALTPGEVAAAGPEAMSRFLRLLDESRHPRFPAAALRARFEQFAAETGEIVPAAFEALKRGDLAAFGERVDRSQALAETKLGNQVEETIVLSRLAREHGAAAASTFGAGFGGSVWALVERERLEDFADRWRRAYLERFPWHAAEATWLTSDAGPPAARLA